MQLDTAAIPSFRAFQTFQNFERVGQTTCLVLVKGAECMLGPFDAELGGPIQVVLTSLHVVLFERARQVVVTHRVLKLARPHCPRLAGAALVAHGGVALVVVDRHGGRVGVVGVVGVMGSLGPAAEDASAGGASCGNGGSPGLAGGEEAAAAGGCGGCGVKLVTSWFKG